jgi:cyclase
VLKRRISAVLLLRDGIIVQSHGFSRYLPVGRPPIAVEFLDRWGIDEIFLVDIGAARKGVAIDPRVVREASRRCFVPLTAGGGLRKLSEVDAVIRAGADKVCLNSAARSDPALIAEIARRYGAQCVVAVVDVVRAPRTGRPQVYDHLTRTTLPEDLSAYLRRLESLGVGEVLVQAVDRDGAGTGFDLELARLVSAAVTVPVIVLGGAGHPRHFAEVLQAAAVQAACAGNFFHFTEHSAVVAKLFATRAAETGGAVARPTEVRLETQATYQLSAFSEDGRLLKRPDQELEKMLYVRIEPEVI